MPRVEYDKLSDDRRERVEAARTVADLAGSDSIETAQLAEAIQ